MSEDSYSEVTNESIFGRIKNAIVGVLFGMILIAVSVGLLFWNEGRTVNTYKALKEGAGLVISIDNNRIFAENEGKLVHISGMATTDEILKDPQFSLSTNAISLKRMVQMYQWQETSETKKRKKFGGGEETVKVYSYDKTWSSQVISSSSFKKPGNHKNPGRMMFDSRTLRARDVSLGAFTLSDSLVGEISSYESLPISDISGIKAFGKNVIQTADGLYIGNDVNSPQIGDMTIQFAHVLPTTVSLVSKQSGNSFKPYVTSYEKSIEELVLGVASAEAIIKKAQSENTLFAWLLRLGGFVLMVIGFYLLFNPLAVIADIVPFIGNIVEFGTGILAFLLSLIISLTTIAIAWIFYRPVLAGVLLTIAVAVIIMGFRSGKKKRIKKPEVKPPLDGSSKKRESSSEEAFEIQNESSSSSKKSTVSDPFLIDD